MNGNRPGKAIIRKRLKTCSVGKIARLLGVKKAHIYNIDSRGVSPTLHEALIEAGWLEAPPRVYTLAFRFKNHDDFERARAAVDRHPGGRASWLLSKIGDE